LATVCPPTVERDRRAWSITYVTGVTFYKAKMKEHKTSYTFVYSILAIHNDSVDSHEPI